MKSSGTWIGFCEESFKEKRELRLRLLGRYCDFMTMPTRANLRFISIEAAGLLLRKLLGVQYSFEVSVSIWNAIELANDMHPDAHEIEQLTDAERLPKVTAANLIQTICSLHAIKVLGFADKSLRGLLNEVLQHSPAVHEIKAMSVPPAARLLLSSAIRDLSRELTVGAWIYPQRAF